MPRPMLAVKNILVKHKCILNFTEVVAFILIIMTSITHLPPTSTAFLPHEVLLLFYESSVVIHRGDPQTQLLVYTVTNSQKQTFHTLDGAFSFIFLDRAFHISILNSSTKMAGSGDTFLTTNPMMPFHLISFV